MTLKGCSNIFSTSEENGIKILIQDDKKIYSVGISTGGAAEIRMLTDHPERHIIATTIDVKGAEFAKKQVDSVGLSNRIEIKIEDVSQPLPYPKEYFDYIYARLVLHYLPKTSLQSALKELYRALRKNGKIFVIVRSTNCPEAQDKNAKLDAYSGLTTYMSGGNSYSRYFHNEESIQNYLIQAGFSIRHASTYLEQLCVDFERKIPSKQVDSLIEVLATK